jgi:hypothetical protein
MIAHFPDAYSGELFYSLCARFADRMRYPSLCCTMREIFGRDYVAAAVDFPHHLDAVVNSLPPGSTYTSESMVDNHTLLPFYAPFLKPENYELVRQSLIGEGKAVPQIRCGIAGGQIRPPFYMRTCPVCDQENQRRHGETYWNRLFQIAGVEVCPIHAVFLEPTIVRRQMRASRYNFVTAQSVTRVQSARQIDPSNRCHVILVQLAENIAWVLDHHGFNRGLLREKKFATRGGHVRMKDLRRELIDHFSATLLELLQSPVLPMADSEWPARLPRKSEGPQAPLRHFLMMNFLGITAERFFHPPPSITATQPPRFGIGPWST